jgi:cation transport regulator ChaC
VHYGSIIWSPQERYFCENLAKVSGYSREYSRFWETLRGDFFDIECEVVAAVDFAA